jgi:hypothetical protein
MARNKIAPVGAGQVDGTIALAGTINSLSPWAGRGGYYLLPDDSPWR